MKHIGIVIGLLFVSALATPAAAETARGTVTGGIVYALPEWFKSSFLNFRDDVEEARKHGKHVLVFLHLDECPYCARTLQENFRSGERTDLIRKHFDVVAVNIRGDNEVTWIDGSHYIEKTLARYLKVFATPTIVFLGDDGNKVLQLTGYRDPRAFGLALDYVRERRYQNETFAAFLARHEKAAVYTLRDHPQFSKRTDLKGYRQPLAVLVEDRECAECAAFHDKVLNRPDVQAEMSRFLFIRLDADSDQPLVDPEGKATTARRWAKELGLTYRPSFVLFDDGQEIFRLDGRVYHFHFREMLRYVGGRHYQQYTGFNSWFALRREEILREGGTVDFGQ